MGCYMEPATTRALTNLYADDLMTIEKCLTYAAAYTYAGIEVNSLILAYEQRVS